MVSVNIKIDQKVLYIIGFVLIAVIIGGLVVAYNPSGSANPAVMGHSANEIAGSSGGAGMLNCVTITNHTSGLQHAIARCPAGTNVTGGGMVNSQGYYATTYDNSQPLSTLSGYSGEGWFGYASDSFTPDTTVYAVCCKIV